LNWVGGAGAGAGKKWKWWDFCWYRYRVLIPGFHTDLLTSNKSGLTNRQNTVIDMFACIRFTNKLMKKKTA